MLDERSKAMRRAVDALPMAKPAPHLNVGDRFTMPITVRRKWWQIWKPREWTEVRTFTVTGKHP